MKRTNKIKAYLARVLAAAMVLSLIHISRSHKRIAIRIPGGPGYLLCNFLTGQ